MKKKFSRAEQKALRPNQILEAAFEEFVEQGYKATRVEDIAKRVGVTKGTVYVYFPTKDELFIAMVRHITMPMIAVAADFLAAKGSYSDRLGTLLRIFYQSVNADRKTRELLRFMIAEGQRFPVVVDRLHDDLMEPIFVAAKTLLEDGARSGEFMDTAPAMARVMVAPILAITVESLMFDDRREVDLASYIETHIELVTRGLLARPDKP